MRIERLRLSNYRGFAELDLEFPKHGTTVLVGNNGAGKTSILDAIGCLLQQISFSMPQWEGATGEPLTRSDLRVGAHDCKIELSTTRSGSGTLRWVAAFPSPGKVTDAQDEAFARDAAAFFGPSHQAPFLIYFSVDRVFRGELSPWLLPDIEDAAKTLHVRTPISTEYWHFVRWFFDRENLENELIRDNPSFRDPNSARSARRSSAFARASVIFVFVERESRRTPHAPNPRRNSSLTSSSMAARSSSSSINSRTASGA